MTKESNTSLRHNQHNSKKTGFGQNIINFLNSKNCKWAMLTIASCLATFNATMFLMSPTEPKTYNMQQTYNKKDYPIENAIPITFKNLEQKEQKISLADFLNSKKIDPSHKTRENIFNGLGLFYDLNTENGYQKINNAKQDTEMLNILQKISLHEIHALADFNYNTTQKEIKTPLESIYNKQNNPAGDNITAVIANLEQKDLKTSLIDFLDSKKINSNHESRENIFYGLGLFYDLNTEGGYKSRSNMEQNKNMLNILQKISLHEIHALADFNYNNINYNNIEEETIYN